MWVGLIKPEDFAMKHVIKNVITEHGVTKDENYYDRQVGLPGESSRTEFWRKYSEIESKK